jgi:transcriptional regulator of arginine metabolism
MANRLRPVGPERVYLSLSPALLISREWDKLLAYLCTFVVYLYKRGRRTASRAFRLSRKGNRPEKKAKMKHQRHSAIRELVAHSLVTNQDELRRKLRRRGFEVTQATLSRDIHELRLSKGPGGYVLPNGNGINGASTAVIDDGPPSVAEMIESFGLRATQAMNQVVVRTVMGGAQPVAAALDREGWSEVVGTIAGDDTVLVICIDPRRAAEVEARVRMILES